MDKSAKIYVAGHHGLVGSAIWNNLKERGYNNLVGRSHKELDLLDPIAVKKFFDEEQPDAVILAAAHVGGIMANLQYRADFIYQNLQIQQNVIGESFRHGVKKLLFLGSTCIYPREAPQPMKEEVLLTLKDFELLKKFLLYPGIVFSRDKLLNDIWGYEFTGETRTVDVHIRTLRQKLGSAGDLIETIRGVGYRMAANK